jgi:signal transduction histidine kinase
VFPGATIRVPVTVDIEVRDDGVGGASTAVGSGLIGLKDRIEAVSGRLDVASPSGGGTTLAVTIPLNP